MDELILAVDGGQTSTKAIISLRDGTILGAGRGTPCDHIHGPNGIARNRAAIHSAAHAALSVAGARTESIIGVGLGLTSAPREGEATPLFRAIVQELCSPRAFWVDSDFVSNLAGASAGADGIVVIAGGGSIGYGTDASGREAISAGLGYLLGDEGSAWYIGLNALQAASQAADRRGRETALLSLVLDHYGLTTVRDIIRIIYDAGFTRDKVSVLAPEVVRLAREGDDVAAEIIRSGSEKLATIALGVARQLYQPGEPVTVYPTGGVFEAGDLVMTPFVDHLTSEWPTAIVSKPRFPPVIGVLIQVWKTLGDPITGERLGKIEETLPVLLPTRRS